MISITGLRLETSANDGPLGIRLEARRHVSLLWSVQQSNYSSLYRAGIPGVASRPVAGCFDRPGAAAALYDADDLGFGLHAGRGGGKTEMHRTARRICSQRWDNIVYQDVTPSGETVEGSSAGFFLGTGRTTMLT